MGYVYIRQAPGFPQLAEQKQDILSFLMNKDINMDKEVVEYATKKLPIDERNEFEDFLQSMVEGSIVIVSSINILSDKTEELVKVITCMLSHNVDLWIAKSNTLINRNSKMIDIFPLLNALIKDEKEKISSIGRPKGSKSSSKFDIYQAQILSLLVKGSSVSAIARELEVSRSSLKDYIESRGMKDLVNGTWADSYASARDKDMDNVLLICPFAQNKKKAS